MPKYVVRHECQRNYYYVVEAEDYNTAIRSKPSEMERLGSFERGGLVHAMLVDVYNKTKGGWEPDYEETDSN
jgi:hypothetical protein